MPTFDKLIEAIKAVGFHNAVFAFVLFGLFFILMYLIRRWNRTERFYQEIIRELLQEIKREKGG